jgi:hypothetical protein
VSLLPNETSLAIHAKDNSLMDATAGGFDAKVLALTAFAKPRKTKT